MNLMSSLSPSVTIHADGSFDIVAGPLALRGCYPAWERAPLRPVRVEVAAGCIRYHLAHGTVEVSIGHDDDGVVLGCRLIGCPTAPRWFSLIHGARIEGADRCYRQGIGFSGPSGVCHFAGLGEEWHLPSHMLCALNAGDAASLVLGCYDHRRFHWRSELRQTAYRHNFRNREIDERHRCLEAAHRLEGLPPGPLLELPALHVHAGGALWPSLRSFGAALAQANEARSALCGRPTASPRYHYCSWYYRAEHFSHADLEEVLAGLDRVDPARQLQTVQIDMGYAPHLGDWLQPSPAWPQGLEPGIRAITARGYQAGVWVAPFMVGCGSRIAREHPEWLLRGLDGAPLVEWRHYDGSRRDHEHHVLDTSHPEALAYLVGVFSTLRSWGVRFFKTDFLEWGYKDSGRVRRAVPGKTGAAYYDEALRAIRAAIGEDSYWLGCICYFAPAIGYMDGMRVSSDVGARWGSEGGTGNDGVGGGTQNMIQESFATLWQNNLLWQCDPDVVFVRDHHVHHSADEVLSLVRWHGLLGHSINTSDDLHRIAPGRQALWRWMRPQAEPWTAELPFFAGTHPVRVAVRDYPQANGWAVLLLNPDKEPRLARSTVAQLVGRERVRCYRWRHDGSEDLGEQGELLAELPGHGSELIFLSRDGSPPPADLTLGGRRGS
jgi:alpha-galactosidase